MNRVALGAFGALLLASAGLFWWEGRAEIERGAPPPDISGTRAAADAPIELPSADPHGRGAKLPGVATAVQSKEEKRFNRYDRNRDGQVMRVEMLSTRVKSFQKLDLNHDNLLSFEEWAVKTSNRFKEIDRNGDGILSRAELGGYYAARDAKAAAGQSAAPRCACAPGKPRGGKTSDDEGEPAD